MLLENINSPKDLKILNYQELSQLSSEIRTVLLQKLSTTGGHVAPNLGMVEVTIALHYVFNSPIDKIIYDVSHQSYVHKILTGRKNAFLDPKNYHCVTGYTNQKESEHDFFTIGHTSTSLSLGCGLAKARDIKNTKENIIAVIGDGSLSGGEAYEGLNNIAELNSNMIVIVNDNDMSIAENHGGLYKNLKLLRETQGKASCNFFKSLGLDYIYIENGHDIPTFINEFEKIKDISHPIVVHIKTIKGKGYAPAEKDKETWHYNMPFDMETGKSKVSFSPQYDSLTAEYLLEEMKEDEKIVAVTSGTPAVFGFVEPLRKKAGKQFIDVGIAEEHAVAFSSALASQGIKPVYGVYSTFIQRTYDQLSQDLCINKNPALILIFGGGLTFLNDVTHLGYFDIPVVSNIPNMVYLAPTTKEEYFAMLDYGLKQTDYPMAIRVPSLGIISSNKKIDIDFSDINKYSVEEKGEKLAIVALGDFFELGKEIKKELREKYNIDATLINPRFITGLDKELLESLKENHSLVITLENGVLDGGFGEKITRFYSSSNMKVLNFGAKKEFTDRLTPEEVYTRNHLTKELIVEDILKNLN
jgi:1-deoxy-D-xylulose-5-phosphate synthase